MYKLEGLIYEIRDFTTNKFYIGSTLQDLNERLRQHKKDFVMFLEQNYHYVSSFEILKNNNYNIFLLEKYFCNDEYELRKREGKWIKMLIPFGCINMVIPCRTIKEYYIDNRDEILEKKKEYYINNKNEILKKQKEYDLKNKDRISEKRKIKILCECGSNILKHNLSIHKKTAKHLNYINKISNN